MVCSFCQEFIDDQSAVCIHCGMRVNRSITEKPIPVATKPKKPIPKPDSTTAPQKPEPEAVVLEPEPALSIPDEPVLKPEPAVSIPDEPVLEPEHPIPIQSIAAQEPVASASLPEIPESKPVIKFDTNTIRTRRATSQSAPVEIHPVKKSKAAAVIAGFLVASLILLIILLLAGIAIVVGTLFLANSGKDDYIESGSNRYSQNASTEDNKEYLFFAENGAYCYHIPIVELDDVASDSINKTMYDVHYAHLEEMVFGEEYPFMLGMTYSVGRSGDIVSVMVQEFCDTDYTKYYIYNFSATTGKEVDNADVFAEFGFSESDGQILMKGSLAAYWLDWSEEVGYEYDDDFTNEIINKTLSDSNIQACIPFIDEDGNLRYVGSIYSLGGADYYDYIFDDNGSIWRVECAQH